MLKIAPLKTHFQNFSLKKTFLKLLSQKRHLQNSSLKTSLLKNAFLKLLSQKRHFQIYSLKKYIFKIVLSKNINLVAIIYSSSQSSEGLSKSSSVFIISYFSIITLFSKYFADNSFQLFWEHIPSWLPLNKYD